MAEEFPRERLRDLLVAPRESLDIEIKNWLDLENSNEDKATFAKAALALANHGGGFIILGLTETATGAVEAEGRPATLNAYQQDRLNGIIHNYADPPFHCAVDMVTSPTGSLFPVVRVPGGHKIPIRAKRAGPNGRTVEDNAIYIRKPGPRSEKPASAMDWEDLLSRCFSNRRDEMLDVIRSVVSGSVAQPAEPPARPRLDAWVEEAMARWQAVIAELPADAAPRFPNGHYRIAYQIVGTLRPFTLAQFSEMLPQGVVRHTGWPPFWYPTRDGIAPYPIGDAVECWIGDEWAGRDPAHADFWRVSPGGLAFLIRGYQEDGPDAQRNGRPHTEPGTVFDVTLPVWRVSETLLHAERLASLVTDGPSTITFSVQYTGLAGRELVHLEGRRHMMDARRARQDSIELRAVVDAATISANLPEIMHPLLEPLYALFDFFQLPKRLVDEEVERLRRNRF